MNSPNEKVLDYSPQIYLLEIEILKGEMYFHDTRSFHSCSQDVLFRGLVVFRA